MKKKMVPLVVALLFLSALAVVIAQTSGVAIGPYGNLKIGPYGNLKIGPYGNLVGLTDTGDKNILTQIREGYAIAYSTKNSKGDYEDRTISAIGDEPTKGLTIQDKRSTNSSRVVITHDKALEITSQFIYDEKAQQLIIDRQIKNISAETVSLQMMREYVDTKLFPAGSQTRQVDFGQVARDQLAAGYCTVCPNDCNAGKCDPPPRPCFRVICPGQNGYSPSKFIAGESSGRQITLGWKGDTTSDENISPAKTVRYVVLVQMH